MHLIFFGDNRYGKIVFNTLSQTNKFKLTPYSPSLTIDKNAIGVVASYGNILSAELIDNFSQIVCLHPSLLPQYRGATPAPYAIAMGDKETGITLFHLTAKIDQGEVIAQQKEPIYNRDTTPLLLTRLFTLGSNLLINWLTDNPTHQHANPPTRQQTHSPLIFTRRFTRQTGYLEWNTFLQLIENQPIMVTDTSNTLLTLRLTRNPSSSQDMLHDLTRALTPWPAVWTIAKTKKGHLHLILTQVKPKLMVKIEGKPKPISWQDFTTYYL